MDRAGWCRDDTNTNRTNDAQEHCADWTTRGKTSWPCGEESAGAYGQTRLPASAAKDYTIQQKEVFQRKVQAELDEMQLRIAHLRGQVTHASVEAKADIQKAIVELEKKKELAQKKVEDIHSATASSWEQVKSKTAAAMDDLRDSFTRVRSHLP